jgi:hypothetical protein
VPYIEQKISREHADTVMAELTACGIPAKIRYHPDGNGATDHEYAIWVDEPYLALALDALDREEVTAERHVSDVEAPEPGSMFSCPRCGQRQINYPDDPAFRVILVSIPFFMIPALGWLIWRKMKGSRKACGSCLHTWRSNP